MPKSKKSVLPMHNKQKGAKGPPAFLPGGIQLNPRSFPLSPWTVVGSLCLWMFIGLAAFKTFLYFGTYRSLDSDLAGSCDVHLKSSLEENMKIAENYSSGDSGPYIKRIGSQMYGETFAGTPSPRELPTVPPLVTAISSGDFFQVQGLIRDIEDVNKSGKFLLKLIIYDIGMYNSEKLLVSTYIHFDYMSLASIYPHSYSSMLKVLSFCNVQMKKHCNCDIRSFDVGHYPDHVAIYSNQAYQPIIMQVKLEYNISPMSIDVSYNINTLFIFTTDHPRGIWIGNVDRSFSKTQRSSRPGHAQIQRIT